MKRLITIVLVVTQCHLFAFRDVKSTFYFDSDIDTLNQIQYSELQSFIQHLPDYKQYKEIYIVGYTDADGSSDYNVALSKRRADFVSTLLIKNGLPEVLIDKNFKGEDNPVAKNTTEQNKSKNRRVEVTLRLFDINTATDIVKEINGNPEQAFYLDNTKENFIQGKNGIKFIFPPYCFKTNGNKKIDYSNIKIVMMEVTNVKQGFFSNVLTESEDGLLETGGMYKITAYNNDVILDMKDNMQYTVQINNNDVKENMTVYTPQKPAADGLVRWINTNTAFEKTSSFKGVRPYLKLDKDIINAWKVTPEMDALLQNYVFQLPVKPIQPKMPSKVFPPYEPKITSAKYKLPWYKKMFMTKAKQKQLVEQQFNKDYEAYKVHRAKYEVKLAKYKEDTAKLRDILANYEFSYKLFKDSVILKIKEADAYRLALYENAFVKSFEYGKKVVLYKLQNKNLYSHDVFQEIMMQCNTFSRLKDINLYYADQLAGYMKKLKSLCKYDFSDQFLTLSYYQEAYMTQIYPGNYIKHFLKLMKTDKTVAEHIAKCEDDMIAEEVKLGLFDPRNYQVFYQASLSNFGWINCDRFMNYKQDEIFTLQIPNYQMKDKNLFAVVKDINSQISIPLAENNMHRIRLPKNKEIVIVAIGLDKDLTPMYAKKSITGMNDVNVDLSFKHAKISEIRQMIEGI